MMIAILVLGYCVHIISSSKCLNGAAQSPVQIIDSRIKTSRDVNFKIQWIPAQVEYQQIKDPLQFKGKVSRITMLSRQGNILSTYEAEFFKFYVPASHKLNNYQLSIEMHIHHSNQRGEKLIYAILFVTSFLEANPNSIISQLRFPKDEAYNYDLGRTQLKTGTSMAYFYEGSILEQPCTQNVAYLIKKQIIIVSKYQLMILETRVKERNFPNRPIQKINGRKIQLVATVSSPFQQALNLEL